MKHWDFALGNPPYQAETENEGDRKQPVYNDFMDAAYEIADCVELIHPARFLFNAGQTKKDWNKKMLNDEHFKVLTYEPDASRVFSNTEIKGGIAITIRDRRKNYGAIGTFTSYPELNSIVHKVRTQIEGGQGLNEIIASQGLFRFSNAFFADNPAASSKMGKGTGSKIVSSVMEKLPEVFLANKPSTGDYVRFLGRIKSTRVYKWIRRDYLVDNAYIDCFKLFIPEANNTGAFGETLTDPIIGFPGDGTADTYLCAGTFDNKLEVEHFVKYMKTKLFRALLGVKKVTQHCPPQVWEMIPIQDFTSASDINWSRSIAEIDQQLYKKYGLTDEEIQFIETHVKEMN